MRKLRLESRQVQLFFVAISLMYYVHDYVITVYSNLMYRGSAAMAEWMSTLIVIMYFVFYIRYIEIVSRQSELQLEKLAYEVSAKHAEKEIDKYRQAQDKLAVYKRDIFSFHGVQVLSRRPVIRPLCPIDSPTRGKVPALLNSRRASHAP